MNVERLPFDQYQRYRLVADLLTRLRKKQPLEVLDVGGRTALLRGFLPKDRVTLVDIEPSAEAGLVLGDGARLPFRDDAFDVVAAFDTLEHVPPQLREAFVAECARVSRGYVVLAGPYHTERVAEAEKLLQKFLKDKLQLEHRYLQEHRHNGLPSRQATEEQLAGLGATVQSYGHANLERWLALMCLSMTLDHDPALRGLASRVHEFYNRALYDSDHAEPVYRHVVVAAFAKQPLPKAQDLLGPPRAPAGALEPFRELTGELAAFDRERAAWREERGKLDQINLDLRRDLQGHAATLEEVERDLGLERDETARLKALLESERVQSVAAIGVLEQDLDQHRRSLFELETEARQLREAQAGLEQLLASEREQALQSIAALESDLAGHRERLTDLLREGEARLLDFERERSELRLVIDALERDLAGHKESLAHVERELAAREEHVAELVAVAARERAEALDSIAQLKAEVEARGRLSETLEQEALALREEGVRVLALLADERGQAERSLLALRQELAAHGARGAELEAELAREQRASRAVAQALEADLAEHKGVIVELRREVEAVLAARAAELESARAAELRLEGEIAAHRSLEAELQREAAALRDEGGRLVELLERERSEGASSLAALRQEIAAHERRGGELEGELAREQQASRQTAAALREDLARHQGLIGEVRAESEALRDELQRVHALRGQELEAARATETVLRQELTAHRGVQAELGAELERHRAVLEQVQAELQRTQAAAQSIQRDLQNANASGEVLGRNLAQREAEVAMLRALLRNRLGNLKRGLWPKKPAF